VAQVGVAIGEIGMPVDPGDELGGAAGAKQHDAPSHATARFDMFGNASSLAFEPCQRRRSTKAVGIALAGDPLGERPFGDGQDDRRGIFGAGGDEFDVHEEGRSLRVAAGRYRLGNTLLLAGQGDTCKSPIALAPRPVR
jgi:hypothetical protein